MSAARRPRPGSGAKGPLKRALLVMALVIYTAFLTEAYFRLFDPQPLMPRYVTGAPWGVRGNIPNARYWNHTPEVDVEYRINGEGLRADRDYPLDKPPGTCRVAVFGDSFFFGIELDLADTFEGQLEKRLAEAGFRTEVMNFAVGGFGTAEMLQTFLGSGRRYHPDVVLFSWDDSDLQDNVRSGLYRLDEGRLERANAEYLPGVKTANWLMQYSAYRLIADHSEFYSFARERIEFLVKRHLRRANRESAAAAPVEGSGGEAASDADANTEQKRRAALLSAALLLRADQEVAAAGADFYVVELPWKLSRTQFSSSIDVLPQTLRSQLKFVPTSAALNQAARPDLKLYFESGQGHLTPKGESILVGETVKHLLASPRLAACALPRGTGR